MSLPLYELCKLCDQRLSPIGTKIRCSLCKSRFHVKCSPITSSQFNKYLDLGIDWYCNECTNSIFPFANLENDAILDLYDAITY